MTSLQLKDSFNDFKDKYDDFKNIEDLNNYIKNNVLKDKIEAENLIINALPKILKIKLIIYNLDRRDTVKLHKIILGDIKSEIKIYLLFKPGHYDCIHKNKNYK